MKKTDARLEMPAAIQEFIRATIASAGGAEVFFLARVQWTHGKEARVATIDEVDVLARGSDAAVPVILERAEDWDLSIHNHPGGDLRPSNADLNIAAELASRSVGFAIIDNEATEHYLVTAPFPREEDTEVDLDEVERFLGPDGCLAVGLEDFETRDGQIAMASQVATSLNAREVTVAEAGTGVGKSFAYLVPAILWAARNRRRVIVSTGTIALQEQLVTKDLPLLAKLLPVEFTFALIKGRGNYACLRKLEEVEEGLSAENPRMALGVNEEEMSQLRDLVDWAGETRDGSRGDLAWRPWGEVWEQVMSESDKSLKVNCKHYQNCFFYQARRRAAKARILVVNHHLFFADLAIRREMNDYQHNFVLPPYQRVIFDEAHHLEDVASEYLGVRVSALGIERRLARMCSPRSRTKGIVPRLVRKLQHRRQTIAADALDRSFVLATRETQQRLGDHFTTMRDRVLDVRRRLEFPKVATDPQLFTFASEVDPLESEFTLRYGKPPGEEFWSEIAADLGAVAHELGRLVSATHRAVDTLDRAQLNEDERKSILLEFSSFVGRTQSVIQSIENFCEFEDASQVRWLSMRRERRGQRRWLLDFRSAPIRVGAELKKTVFDPLHTVVLTSATLSVAEKIDYLLDRLGLDQIAAERFVFKRFSSPFDFARQTLTVIPTDIASPESSDFASAVPEAVLSLIKETRGRAFVLFTSYALLKSTYAALADRLTQLGLTPMAQGDAERIVLLERFKSANGGVLFGTDSFWEGVDVKGRALECVIITRLPFRVPTEPVQEARMEDLAERGMQPFRHFTLPQAILKFRQGFGRLIRSTTDRGVVAVLDRRIVTKPYGRIFLRSLPDTRVVKAPLAELTGEVGRFLEPPAAVTVDAQERAPNHE